MNSTSLSLEQHVYLTQLGVSKDGRELYSLLLQHKSLTAHTSSVLRGTYASAEYRLFYELERLGLVREERKRPKIFKPVAITIGMRAAYTNVSTQLSKLLSAADGSKPSELELIVGRQALYDRYIELAEAAEHEVWIYAIGIAYNKRLDALQRQLVKRGVSVHHIVQELKPSNFHVVQKWLRYGMRVKHLPSSRGFHLMVFDTSHVIISFSDPNNTDERLSIVTNNPQAIRVFRAQFSMLWAEAKDLD